ncbi:hypothetical protein EVAR_41204_1 [Eumeta japonica]|uniref:Uncharacterized protein n=1 Tax=Eumeta variegata TaxID=151549 RepID=A0A4C1WTB2_EUMVA|nr:hypothetical protein EVAR_41204_1 [Eumeta japonica]
MGMEVEIGSGRWNGRKVDWNRQLEIVGLKERVGLEVEMAVDGNRQWNGGNGLEIVEQWKEGGMEKWKWTVDWKWAMVDKGKVGMVES